MKNLYRYTVALVFATCFGLVASAQVDRREVRQGNRQFRKEEWSRADVSYRKALLKDTTSFAANFNLADNLYRQDNMEEAAKFMDKIQEQAQLHPRGGDAYFNRGDIAIKQKDWQTAVDVFKKAVLSDPEDLEAKENYVYAKKMLEDQQRDQDKNQQDQNQDQNQDENQDQNQDQQSQDQNQDGNQQDQNRDQQQNRQQSGISPQQAQQMLRAIQAKEKETQAKVNKEKADFLQSKQREKNW